MAPRKRKRTNFRAIPEEDGVTMSTLRELLDNQKTEFTNLMQLQEKNFTSRIETVMDTTNRRIDNLVREVQAVKGSLQYSQREIEGVKSSSQEQKQRIDEIESQIAQLRSDITMELTRDDHSYSKSGIDLYSKSGGDDRSDSRPHRDDHSDSQSHRDDHSDSQSHRDDLWDIDFVFSDNQFGRDDDFDSQSHTRDDHSDSQSHRNDHSDSQSHRGDLSDSESYRSRSSLSYNIDNDSTLYQDYYQDDYESDHQEDYDHESDYPSDNQMRDVFDDESDDDDSDVARASDMWQLSVKGPDGSTIFVRIHKDATVDEVISQVSKRKGTPLEHLRVMYTTELLEYGQGKHLSDYHIQDMYTLHYVIDRGGPPSDRQTCSDPQEHQEETTNDPDVDENSNIWQLSAKLNSTSSHCIPIKIHKDAPVDDLIEKISERNKVPIESQSVVFTTKRLEYGQGYYLSDYGIQDKSTLLVVLRLKGLSSDSPTSSTMWQLTVKDQAGLTCHIKICKDTLVDKLIDKVGELYGSRRERLRFLYMGDKPRLLEYGRGKRLSDYGIKDKSTIEVFFRIGGPPSDSHTPQEEQQEDVKAVDASDVKKGSNMWQLTVRQLSGHKDDIVIHKDATVDELMGKISERSGVPATQILHILYKGQKLYQGRHLSDYPLQNNSTLFLALRLGGPPQPKPT